MSSKETFQKPVDLEKKGQEQRSNNFDQTYTLLGLGCCWSEIVSDLYLDQELETDKRLNCAIYPYMYITGVK